MPLSLIYGDNTLEIEEAVRTLRQAFNPADVITIEGATASIAAIAEASLTAGLFDPDRLVLVHDLHQRLKGTRKGGDEAEELTRLLGNVAPTTTLILISPEMAADHQLVFIVRSVGGKVQEFTIPKKGELPRWIMGRGKYHGVTVEPEAADLLAEMLGPNPVLLQTELEKLATYAGSEQRVTARMVDTLVGAVTQDSIFALVDAIAAGNLARALHLMHVQLEAASSSPIDVALYLIRMLARQMRILLRIRLGQEAGTPRSRLIGDLKLQRYFADRYFRQAERLSRQRLTGTFERLAAFEYALKSGQADPTTGLDLLVSELCS